MNRLFTIIESGADIAVRPSAGSSCVPAWPLLRNSLRSIVACAPLQSIAVPHSALVDTKSRRAHFTQPITLALKPVDVASGPARRAGRRRQTGAAVPVDHDVLERHV